MIIITLYLRPIELSLVVECIAWERYCKETELMQIDLHQTGLFI